MSNTYFQFKQFRVAQEKAAMKVCTDACLFGAWTAAQIRNLPIRRILDIGSGTGLLSLMLAQKSNAKIDAVEIDEAAYLQTTENFDRSPWKERLRAVHIDILDYSAGHGRDPAYDLIITNPPFYEKDLRSPVTGINMARHDESLTIEKLPGKSFGLLADQGLLSVLLPNHRAEYFIKMAAEAGLTLQSMLQVRQSPKHEYFRACMLFRKHAGDMKPPEINELTIREVHHNYSLPFIALLEDYYLSL